MLTNKLGPMRMPPNLLPSDPLSQVVFVHDYIQLVFQDTSFTLYNTTRLTSGESSVLHGQAGFADALVALIDQRVASVSTQTDSALALVFENGVKLQVLRGKPYAHGPEAFQFITMGGPIVVEANE
jgi:hypothetical protein